VPSTSTGARRAVLIGINYTGQQGELSGCQNDCLNVKDYIMAEWGFKEDDIILLMDDGVNQSPTQSNILDAYRAAAAATQSGDALFCHYSGRLKISKERGGLVCSCS
jgi:metacaspase-1